MENDKLFNFINSIPLKCEKGYYKLKFKDFVPMENEGKPKENYYFHDMMFFDKNGNLIPYPEYIKLYGQLDENNS